MKLIALLGGTGSIGLQTINVVKNQKDKFSISLIAIKRNVQKLIELLSEYPIPYIAIEDENLKDKWESKLLEIPQVQKVYWGREELLNALSEVNYDVCINAIVGWQGIFPTLKCAQLKKTILLANKEALVVAGDFIMQEVHKNNVKIIPIDSEHSALFQIFNEGEKDFFDSVVLTCSGGPFWKKKPKELENVSVENALNHPVWKMGTKITLDSATLMNKSFEIIEAHHLFNLPPEKIQIVIHPQAYIHAMIKYIDGTIKMLAFPPTMEIPIQYALSFPEKWHNNGVNSSFPQKLEFYEVNTELFPSIPMAYQAIKKKGNVPAILNFANDFAQELFLKGIINFPQIFNIIKNSLDTIPYISKPNLDTLVYETPLLVKETVNNFLKKYSSRI